LDLWWLRELWFWWCGCGFFFLLRCLTTACRLETFRRYQQGFVRRQLNGRRLKYRPGQGEGFWKLVVWDY